MNTVTLLQLDGTLRRHDLRSSPEYPSTMPPPTSRMAFAAAHVVPKVWGDNTPGKPADIDWDSTLQFRHAIWDRGLGVADAMDTAQRNMGLDWTSTAELIQRSAQAASSSGGALVVGVNTDHLGELPATLSEVIDAYLTQLELAEDAGADVVMMASRHLASAARSPADYERVYGTVLNRAGRPVILHWLGSAFDRRLGGYFGSDVPSASDTVIRIIEDHTEHVAGIKMSLLDAEAEIALRRRLPSGVRMFTGDDFNYVDLIAGDDFGHSDALLGAFAAFPSNASAALNALDRNDVATFRSILDPTEALARVIFEAPTQFYKVGIAFLSWLNGYQSTPQMVVGIQAARSLAHLSRVVELADAAGALEHPELAARRWAALLQVNGVEQ